jgi:hypothetical protein
MVMREENRMQNEYANCPFCGSDDTGPSYSEFTDRGRTWHVAMAGCGACGAHGPVRNDYPENPIATPADEAKADEIEAWTKAAWNRMPAITADAAKRLDARFAPNG